jgi:hypothetical protein
MDPTSEDPAPSPLQRTANRRSIRKLAVTAVVIAVLTPIGTHGLLFRQRQRQPVHHHHTSPVGGIIALTVLALVIAGALLLMRRSYKRGGFYSPPALYGLPRRDRRDAARAIRNGQLSEDPQIREAQIGFAARTVERSRSTTIIYALMALGWAWALLLSPRITTFGRVYFLATILLFAWGLRRRPQMLRGSRLILAQAGTGPMDRPG